MKFLNIHSILECQRRLQLWERLPHVSCHFSWQPITLSDEHWSKTWLLTARGATKRKKKKNDFIQKSSENDHEHYKVRRVFGLFVIWRSDFFFFFFNEHTCSGRDRAASLPDSASTSVWTDCCTTLCFTLASPWRSWRTLSPLWGRHWLQLLYQKQVTAPLLLMTADNVCNNCDHPGNAILKSVSTGKKLSKTEVSDIYNPPFSDLGSIC